MKKSNNLNNILEIFWLIITILTLVTGIHSSFKHGFKNSYIFFIMTILAFLLYLARRTLRIKNSTDNQ